MTASREQVVAFVAHQLSVRAERLTDETTLFGQLGADGADGREFMAAFSERFGVDLSGFEPARYFGPEGLPLLWPFHWLAIALRRGTPERRAGLDPISIGRLVHAANVGRWEARDAAP